MRPILRSTMYKGYVFLFAVTSLIMVTAILSNVALAQKAYRNTVVLRRALDDALAERVTDFQARLEIVKQVDRLLVDEPDEEVWIKARLVEALANMRLNHMQLSSNQIADLRHKISRERFPELWFRCRSLEAAHFLLTGKRQESLIAFKALLTDDVLPVDPVLINRARINYAVALEEDGRTGQAADLFESILMSALEQQSDLTALHSGNNLSSILYEQGDFKSVRRILEELSPSMQRNPTRFGTLSLLLRELSITGLENRPDEAVGRLGNYLEQDNLPPLLVGRANQLLADALLKSGRNTEALGHARRAVAVLAKRANENADARLTLAKVLMSLGEHDGVQRELDKIDWTVESLPVRLTQRHRLNLEASLLQANRIDEAEMLRALVVADEENDKQMSEKRFDYFEARIAASKKTLALQEAEAKTAILEKQNSAERQFRNQIIGLLLVTASVFCVSLYLAFRRRIVKLRLAEQRMVNEKLESLVNAKTQELTDSLSVKAEMAMALERKRRVEVVGQMAGNIAHDINNLLQIVSSTNQTIALPDCSDEIRNELLDVSNKSLEHGAGIIQQLLSYSRRQSFSISSMSVTEFLADTKALFAAAVGRSIELQIIDNSQNSVIRVDESQLTTAILNMLTNSADAMPNGGVVKLVAEQIRLQGDQGWEDLALGDYLLIRIIDTGCGMNADEKERAFEPFFTTKEAAGVGLGLSSAFGYARQSGGDMRITSKPDEGTTVEMLIPLQAITEDASQPAVRKSGYLANKRMLLVEDHDSVATALKALLGHMEIQVCRVASGDEAQKLLINDSNFDFILSDVHMPGRMDGSALAKWVGSEFPQLPILLMTGNNQLPLDSNSVPLITKPFNFNQLSIFLTEHIKN